MELKDKIAVVTGAGGAIGSALVEKLKDLGAKVVEIDKTFGFKCDFSNPDSVSRVSNEIAKNYPQVDYLFNVAGVGVYKDIEKLSPNEWRDVFEVNVTTPFVLTKTLLPSIKNSKSGMIFNIGSGMGVIPAEGRISYCSSKFALRGFSLSLAKDLKKYGIDVCHLTLGSVMTPFGTGGIDKRRQLEREGKKYLSVVEVVDKVISIILSDCREVEYTLYPEGYL